MAASKNNKQQEDIGTHKINKDVELDRTAETVGLVTEAQLKKWEKEHTDGFYRVDATTPKGAKFATYFRFPAISELEDVMGSITSNKGILPAYRQLAEATIIGGYPDMFQNRHTYRVAMQIVRSQIDSDGGLVNY